jgi:hypothetical protein
LTPRVRGSPAVFEPISRGSTSETGFAVANHSFWSLGNIVVNKFRVWFASHISLFALTEFVANRCEPNSISGSKFPHLIAGPGRPFKKSMPLSGTSLLERVRKESANFVRSFYETKDSAIISGLSALA